LVFVLVRSLGLSQVVVVLVVGLEILQVVSLLGILPLVLNTGIGRVVALRWRGGTIHSSPFVVLVLLQAERVGFLRVVTGVVYVDDIFFCGSSNSLIVRFVEDMSREFEMSMTGELQFFLGLQIKQSMEGTFMHQAKYNKDIVRKFKMEDSKAMAMPMSMTTALDADEEGEHVDQKEYRSMVGSLLYLTVTRPDIQFSVCLCARFQASPRTSHRQVVKRIFRYLRHTPNFGL
jgi:hypothetical protein